MLSKCLQLVLTLYFKFQHFILLPPLIGMNASRLYEVFFFLLFIFGVSEPTSGMC